MADVANMNGPLNRNYCCGAIFHRGCPDTIKRWNSDDSEWGSVNHVVIPSDRLEVVVLWWGSTTIQIMEPVFFLGQALYRSFRSLTVCRYEWKVNSGATACRILEASSMSGTRVVQVPILCLLSMASPGPRSLTPQQPRKVVPSLHLLQASTASLAPGSRKAICTDHWSNFLIRSPEFSRLSGRLDSSIHVTL